MRQTRLVGPVAILIATMLFAIGAGSASAVPVAGTSATATKVDTIEWAQAVWSGAYWGIYAAERRGFFRAQNLKVDINIVPSSPSILAAAEGGSVHIFGTATDSAVLAISRGAKVSLVAGIQRVAALQFMTAPGIQRLDQIKGSTIGGTNLASSDTLFARLFLKRRGIEDGEFSVVAVGTFPQRAAALLQGQIKAAMLTEPWSTQLELSGARKWGDADTAVGSNYNFLNIGVAKDWARANRGKVVRFLRAYAQGVEWLHNPKNKAAAMRLLQESRVGLTAGQAKVTYDTFIGGSKRMLSAVLTDKDVLTGIRVARSLNLPTASTDRSVYWDPSYWTAARPKPAPKKG
jgi:ABC-type nitrate/sulfonate/bicarbonate transport system substrate-binding protein